MPNWGTELHCDAALAKKTGNGELAVLEYEINKWQKVPKEWQCKNNPWVKCLEQNKCDKCGWNPEVAEKRIEARANTQRQRK